MAERRAVTARDIKGNVEGYQEMSDEAFARRFYSDRAELIALGVPLHSKRDEYTGEELYTMRSEAYFLPQLDPKYSAELAGRLGKLEGAISKQRTVKFNYWSISRDSEEERTLNPYALFQDNGAWYVVGQDLVREDIRTFRVSRIRGDIRFATRRERDFRPPAEFGIDAYRGRPPWQIGDLVGEARIEVGGDTAWWVQRAYGQSGRIEDGAFVTQY